LQFFPKVSFPTRNPAKRWKNGPLSFYSKVIEVHEGLKAERGLSSCLSIHIPTFLSNATAPMLYRTKVSHLPSILHNAERILQRNSHLATMPRLYSNPARLLHPPNSIMPLYTLAETSSPAPLSPSFSLGPIWPLSLPFFASTPVFSSYCPLCIGSSKC
jgi:hypothetical protein